MTALPAEQLSSGWPWRPGNDFRLLDGAGDFFPRMLEAIAAAQSHVLLEMYLVSSGYVAGAFIEALDLAHRGRPLGPALDVYQDAPDRFRRRIDMNGLALLHALPSRFCRLSPL